MTSSVHANFVINHLPLKEFRAKPFLSEFLASTYINKKPSKIWSKVQEKVGFVGNQRLTLISSENKWLNVTFYVKNNISTEEPEYGLTVNS